MCKFCDIIAGRRKKDILFQNTWVVVFLGRPHHLGHTQVVLREHKEDLTALSEKQLHAFVDDMVMVALILEKILKPDKLNYELFGNWVPHLHWHILPRFKNDPDFGNPPGEPLRNKPFTHRILSEEKLKRIKDELKKMGVARR
jgi:diadenosine tetraphosphate (Ap4A) HIT family hydrolase